jgi:hypothetical protein
MAWNINSAKLVIEMVDDSTGEVITREATLGDFKEAKKTTTRTRKPKDDGSTKPQVILLEGKVQLNQRAQELTGWEPEMKIDIQFEKKGRITTPVMMPKDSGNRLTKTFTVSCRGSKHDNLAEYGDTFDMVPYENKEGYFKLLGNNVKEDDVIDVPEEITHPDELDEDNLDESGIDLEDFDLNLED